MSAPLPQADSPTLASVPFPASPNEGSFRPHPPEIVDFGRKPALVASHVGEHADEDKDCQISRAVGVVVHADDRGPDQSSTDEADVFDHSPPAVGQKPAQLPATVRQGLALIEGARPLRNLGGRPKAIDDVAKIKIATLMATGASLRQVAGFLGVSHTTVAAAIAADPALKQEIDAARQRAVLHPLACIVRESGRNWKAAAWLMDYLNKQANRELPADDRNREEAEAKAAVLIQNDLAGEIRQQAKIQREAHKRREEDEQWRREIAERKARKLARAQQQQQPTRSAAPTIPSPAAAPP